LACLLLLSAVGTEWRSIRVVVLLSRRGSG